MLCASTVDRGAVAVKQAVALRELVSCVGETGQRKRQQIHHADKKSQQHHPSWRARHLRRAGHNRDRATLWAPRTDGTEQRPWF